MTVATEDVEPGAGGLRLARNSVLNLTALVAPLAVALITLPILIDALGTERFGVLAIAWMLLAYLSDLGFGSTTTRYAAEAIGAGRSGEVAGIAWTTAGLQAAIGAILGLGLAAATPWLVETLLAVPADLTGAARRSFYLLAASLPLVGLGRAFRGLVEAAQRFDLALLVHLPLTVASYVLAAVVAVAGWPLEAVFAVIVLFRVIGFPAFLGVARRALPEISLRPVWSRSGVREMMGFAGWVAVSTVASPLLIYLDRFMVGILLSMTAVTFYAAPYEVIARLAMIPGAIVGALYPALSQLSGAADRERAEALATRSTSLMVVVVAPLLVLVVGGAADGLAVWLGPEYAEQSALALRILAVGVLVNAAAHVPFGLLQTAGRPDLPARFHVLELPLQVLLAWVLVARFGITGAALAWSARMVLDAALLFGATARLRLLRFRVLARSPLPRVTGVAVLGLCGALIAAVAVVPPAARLAAVVLIAAATALALWRGGTSAEERRRLLRLLRPRAARG